MQISYRIVPIGLRLCSSAIRRCNTELVGGTPSRVSRILRNEKRILKWPRHHWFTTSIPCINQRYSDCFFGRPLNNAIYVPNRSYCTDGRHSTKNNNNNGKRSKDGDKPDTKLSVVHVVVCILMFGAFVLLVPVVTAIGMAIFLVMFVIFAVVFGKISDVFDKIMDWRCKDKC